MQFPESWLREFCNPPLDTQALADLLTMSGMEVEDLRPVCPNCHAVIHLRTDRPYSIEDVKAFLKGPAQAPSGAPAPTGGMGIPEIPAQDFSKFGAIETKPLARIKRANLDVEF